MTDWNYSDYDTPPAKPDLAETLAALQANEPHRPDTTVFYGLSGLVREELIELYRVWERLAPAYRRTVMRELVEMSEANFEMDYRAVGILGLNDPDPGVREAAVEVLWEDNSLELMSLLVQIAATDEVREVRAAAVSALGRFILMGELGDLPEDEVHPAQNIVVRLLTSDDEDYSVRRRALEAISNCSHEIVPRAIQTAYEGENHAMRVSAIFAMGRSCDNRWDEIVLHEIENSDAEIRYEAARASGELEISEAVPGLARLALEDEREIQEVAIWSLGEIGGREAMRILTLLAEKIEAEGDEALLEVVEDAIGTAALMSDDLPGMWML
jgi:hypothetical protein